MQKGNVTLGEFEFNPVEEQDFRLAVEGASKTGKSNTLSVILEDLADANIPTLIIERLGILSTVRKEDDRMIVVGARPEKGVDLAIPMDQLDQVVDLMFDRSLKVILDVSTYEDEGEGHTEHKAAAKVLKALNSRARENLRSGNRIKCLTVIDEVHMLAPETNAPIDADDYVKRCKSQIVKLSTEGGNKGINLITAYQRRAYTSKGVVSQSDNYVIHRLHATDRKDVAREIGVDQEEIENLGTGEILAYGDLTKQRVVGATKVRKRRSPDPREANFELPEPSEEISEAVSDLQEQIQVEKKKEKERQNKIKQLEEELEKKTEKIEEMQSEREIQERIAEALEDYKGSGDVDQELKQEVEQLEQIKQEKKEIEKKLENKDEQLETLYQEIEEKEDKIDDLEAELSEKKEIEVVEEEIESNARSILRQIGASDPEVDEAREEINELKSKIEDLREQKKRIKERDPEEGLEDLEGYQDFLNQDAVQKEIEEAKEAVKGKASPRYVKGVVAGIIQNGGWVSYDEIAQNLDVTTTQNVSSAASTLENRKIIKKERRDDGTYVDLNLDGLNEIRKAANQREKTKEIMEDL